MIFAYLDEFGHAGPFYGREHPRFNTSPVFGLGGILLPETAARQFSTMFLKLKTHLLDVEIQRSGKNAYAWEKKGSSLFTAKSVTKYPAVKAAMFRLLNEVRNCQGKVFYSGREKIRDTQEVNANGLYTTVFSDAIRQINAYCESIDQNFVLIVDEHSARKELLETAAKTMFGTSPARRLLSPPFEVESYLNQNVQAADWIATIVGRLWNFRLNPTEFAEYDHYERYFGGRLHSVATHSSVKPRAKKTPSRQKETHSPRVGELGERIMEALAARNTVTIETIQTFETSVTIKSNSNDPGHRT